MAEEVPAAGGTVILDYWSSDCYCRSQAGWHAFAALRVLGKTRCLEGPRNHGTRLRAISNRKLNGRVAVKQLATFLSSLLRTTLSAHSQGRVARGRCRRANGGCPPRVPARASA